METDHETLEVMNVEIGLAESRGDKGYFEDVLASSFAFRRVTGIVVDRRQYIDAVAPSAVRTTNVRSITYVGDARAVVSCIVTMEVQGAQKAFDNLRVFIRADDRRWRLLAWANEAM